MQSPIRYSASEIPIKPRTQAKASDEDPDGHTAGHFVGLPPEAEDAEPK
jgi:hypothetical protein